MGILREIPPTAGWPIYFKDILGVLGFGDKGTLEQDFRSYFKVDYVRLTNSGTTAFYLILEALKELSAKKTVIIPSYICPLVPLAIARAGLKAEVCDITGKDFNFDFDKLRRSCAGNEDVLAIVAVHIGGIPVDVDEIRLASGRGAFIIEDCAQSLGALYKGKPVGTLGDVSFFSLCRGKGLTIYEGGVIMSPNRELENRIDYKIELLVRGAFLPEALKIMELFGYWFFYRPQWGWFVFQLPKLFWKLRGRDLKADSDEYNMDFPVYRVSKLRRSIGHLSFHNLGSEIQKQREKAGYYIRHFQDMGGVSVIAEKTGDLATYPFIFLVFDSPGRRLKVYSVLSGSGLGVSQVYSEAVTGYDYLRSIIPDKDSPGGRLIARSALSLSTSVFLRESELERVVKAIKRMLS